MKKLILSLLLLSMLGCSFGGGGGGNEMPPVTEIPTLAPQPQPFRTSTTYQDGVLSIDVRMPEGGARTLDTRLNADYTWELFLPRPVQPNHRSREWLLTENHYDARIMLYAVASWDDDNPADYLTAGWWLIYPPGTYYREFQKAERGVFIDGPELDTSDPPDLPISGTASYVGGMGGLYEYKYGNSWGELKGTSEYTEFSGQITLTADFSEKRISGCLGCASPIQTAAGRHLFPIVPWQGPDPAALPEDYDIHFSARFGANGAFESSEVSAEHPERDISASAGTWRGQFSNVPDAGGNPRRVVGSTDVLIAERDGSVVNFKGIFDALTPPTFKP